LILTAAGETKRFETHRFEGHVAGKNHQIRPRDALAILLLYRPKQAPSFVEIRIVGPAIERFKPLLTATRAAPAIGDTVGARTVPCHPNKKWRVGTVIRGPPILCVCQNRRDILLDGVQIEFLKLRGILKIFPHGIRFTGMLAKRRQIQSFRPPELIGTGLSVRCFALCCRGL